MAVLGRLLVSSAERLDLPDFLSIDSYTQGDFKYLLKSFVGDDKPFILKGFDVINPGNAIGTQNISVRVADSVVYYPGSLAGPYFHGLEEGNSQSAPLVPELRKNATNYVYLTLTTTEAAKDTRAFWDPDKEGGEGGEFTQDVNTQTVLSVDINVSVSSFPENTVPVCKVVVGANFIDTIEDARDMMFRLGSGGLNPDPLDRYDWREDPTSAYSRSEPNTLMSSALDPNPFEGGDKNIQSLKEWMDAIMTKLAELGGTTYWYEDTSVFNLINVFKDALTTSIKSKGYWNSSDVTPGALTWSEDINVQQTSDSSELIIRAGSKTLADNEVLYIDRVRDVGINTGGVSVEWFNAVNHVNGQLGAFENLAKGDWVKKADDSDNLYLRVEEFYAAANKGGGVTAAGSALSIKLSAPYAGISESKQASYIKGVYLASEVDTADRSAQAIQDAAGNFYWLAMRSDTILNISDLTTTTLSLDIENHDGTRAKVTSTSHGLSDGQRITIAGSTNFDGTYACSVEDTNTFYIDLDAGPFADELAQSGFYATVTTAARSTDDGLQLESANHGLSADQRAIISDTTNYNGDYQVFPTGNTTFTIPVGSAIVNETAGTNTAVNIYVRTDIGPTKLERGENKAIGEVETANLMSFIGMDNDAQTHPNYYVAPDYNTLDGKENFNSDLTDNLTHRVSKLTSMMADRAQDKTLVQSATGITSYSNITSLTDQLVSFIPGGTFTALQPGSPGNTTISLGSTLTLGENQVATYSIDRNTATSIADLTGLTVYDIADCPIEENLFIFAYRFTGTKIYLWDGTAVDSGITPTAAPYIQKVRYIDLLTTTLPATAVVTIDGSTVVNGDTVLFTELTVDPGVYVAAGIGVAATWTKVGCFQGGTDPLNGSSVNILDGTSYFDSTWRFDGSRWKPLDGDIVAKARTGFPTESKENTDISFVDGTRTFSITPTAGSFDIYQRGIPYRFDSAQSVILPDTEGSHFVYFDDGVLVTTTTFDFDLIEEWVYVANIYWDADNNKGILVGDERHGLGMDAKTHEYLHNINGAQINNGFALGNFTTTGTGGADADAQMSIANGTIRDEDIVHSIVDSATPSANFEQILDPIAELPIWYRDGANGYWRRKDATTAPINVELGLAGGIEVSSVGTDSGTPYGSDSSNYITQTFTTTGAFSLDSVVIPIKRNTSSSGSINMEIWGTDGGGNPDSSNVIATSTNTVNLLTLPLHPAAAANTTFNFSSEALSASTQYAIVIHETVPASGTVIWNYETGSYSGGKAAYSTNPTGPWTSVAGDLYFEVHSPTSPTSVSYNEFTGSTWKLTNMADDKFMAMWVFVTNDINEPVIAMTGQNTWDTLGDAQDGEDYNSISFGTMPSQEFKVAYRLIFETSSAYANAYKSKLVDVRDLRQALDTAAPAYAGSYHGSLSGLTDQHHPGSAIYVDNPALFSGAMTPDDDDLDKALLAIDPWFSQLRIKEHPTNKKRVTISAADALRTEGTTLSQVVKNLLLKFDGAEIDFTSGSIYEDDGTTPLGIDFTPETIPAGEWQWYSITLIPSTVNADNTINGQIVVLPGSTTGATKDLAGKAPFSKGTQLGMVAVQESLGSIADIPQTDIRQLGVGGGSGGGEGDANELLERVKNRLDIGDFDVVTPVVFSSVEEDLTDDPSTTASYDVANSLYNFELIGNQFVSVQTLDSEFLAEEKDITEVELVSYWDLDKLDALATYEVSRDGGNEYQAITTDRIGNSDTFWGRHVFSEESTFPTLIENLIHDTDIELTDTILARGQEIVVSDSMTIKRLTLGVSVIGTVQGAVTLQLVRDNAGFPSTDASDIMFESVAQDISGLAAGDHDITVSCTVPVNAGSYHIVIKSDLEYRDNFLTTVNALRVRTDSAGAAPTSSELTGGWTGSVGKLDHKIEGRIHELKIRITSGTLDVDLNGFAVFYDKDDSFSLISDGYDRQLEVVSGDDNVSSFAITEFTPDPILMQVYEIETGQVYRKGAWTLNGTTVEFPANTFDKPGETITLEFLQVFKGSMQFDSRNRAILAENNLGSQDPSLDLSNPGRGIILQRPDGTLREITINDDDNIEIKTVP